jgi:hypothetical protein
MSKDYLAAHTRIRHAVESELKNQPASLTIMWVNLLRQRSLSYGIIFLASVTALFGQADRATLNGTVTDPAGAVVPAVRVKLSQATTGFTRETLTSGAGTYIFPGLPVGAFELTVEKEGFAQATVKEVVLTVGQRATVNMTLSVASVATQVDVTAQAVELDKSSAEVATVIGSNDIAAIPINGRNWSSFLIVAPGAVNTGEGNQNSTRFFGRSRDENNWTFDGVDATGVKDPRQEANLRLVISLDSIAEFRVSSANYTAEIGGGAGAQVNVVSKSGTNEFHSSVFEYFRNDVMDARRPIDAAKPPFRLNQYGGNIGGPIIKNRTFFFANYEGLQQRLGQTFVGFVPSASYKDLVRSTSPALRPVVDAYPAGTARTADPTIDQINTVGAQPWQENSGLIKVDHRFNDRNSMFVRYNTNVGLIDEIRNALLETRTSDFSTHNATIQYQRIWSPQVLSETKIAMNRSVLLRNTNGTFSEGVSIPGYVSLQVNRREVEAGTTFSLVQTLAWTTGRHAFKFGGEIRPVYLVFSDTGQASTSFASRSDFVINKANSISISGNNPSRKVQRPYYFLFAQDEWKLRKNLTLSLGARYEYYAVSKATDGAGRTFDLYRCAGFCASGTPWYFPDKNNLAPRVGLAWSPEGTGGKTVLRFGYGLFYGPGQLDDVNASLDSIPENAALTQREEPNLSFPAIRFAGQAKSQGASPRSLQRDRSDGYSQQWSFTIQQQLPWDLIGQAGYMGSNAHHQFNRTFVNTINPLTGTRPLPTFSNVDEKQNNGNSSFNGLQTSLMRSTRYGLNLNAQYMYSKNISDNAGAGDGGQAMISACRQCERGPADWDVRHTFTSIASYQLPFGAGRAYGPKSGFGAHLLGGWELSGLWTARTGRPVNVTVNRSASDLPDGVASTPSASAPPQRPNYVAGQPLYPGTQTVDGWLNPAAYSVPARGTWGNLGRNAVRAPGMWQVDMALGKQTRITERFNIEFRGEVYNLFNRAQYGLPLTNISQAAQFGRIVSVINPAPTGLGGPRQIQLMLRLNY